ncbi:hypothetical protein ANN_18534 [Periplaneta americana]|uniref:Uncharacterized protein n=1 Tax=Periplaneta americana TaxID=6978 RepID=A0ABQ8SP10_PERAM|nr:hypothetical protein ANN_18534 [Periplaneta americana]
MASGRMIWMAIPLYHDFQSIHGIADQFAIHCKKLLGVQFIFGSLYAVMWLADEPRECSSGPLGVLCAQPMINHRPSNDVRQCFPNSTPRRICLPLISGVDFSVPLFLASQRGCTDIEEQRLRVFENKMLRKIFGAKREIKRDEVIGEWRKLHNAELHAMYSSHCINRIRNESVSEKVGEERMMLKLIRKRRKKLVGSLAEKKLPTEGCTGKNGERENSTGQKKISDDR